MRAGAARTSDRPTHAGTIPGVTRQQLPLNRLASRSRPAVAFSAAVLTLAAGCASPPPSPLPRKTLEPSAWLTSLPATHDALSGVLGALAGAGRASALNEVRQDVLAGYLVAIEGFGPTSTPELFPSDAHVLAYLVDAHLAWTITLGEARRLRKLDVDALRRIPFPLDRRTSTLAALEAEIARRAPLEPRLGLLLNPGWKGGPPLPASALEGHSLDWQLAAHAALCGGTPGFWDLDRERRVLKVSAFTDSMWGLPTEQPARARRLLELVPPPDPLRATVRATCGPSLVRCTVASVAPDRGRFFEGGQRR